MMTLSEADDKINRFHSIRTIPLLYLASFSFGRLFEWEGKVNCNVEVSLKSDPQSDSVQLKLTFYNVTEVKIGDLNSLLGCLVTIRNISERQLENTIYHAFDAESEYFSLHCKDFEFEISE